MWGLTVSWTWPNSEVSTHWPIPNLSKLQPGYKLSLRKILLRPILARTRLRNTRASTAWALSKACQTWSLPQFHKGQAYLLSFKQTVSLSLSQIALINPSGFLLIESLWIKDLEIPNLYLIILLLATVWSLPMPQRIDILRTFSLNLLLSTKLTLNCYKNHCFTAYPIFL